MNRLQKRNTSKTTNQSERSETTLFSPTHQAQITTAIDSTHHQENSSLLANTESIIDNSAHLDTTPVLTLTTSTLSINETRNHSATQAQSSTIEQFLETQIEIVAQLDYEPIDFSEPMEDEDEDQMEHQRQKSFIQASTNSLLKQSVSILQRPVKLQVLSDMKFYGHDDRSRNANAITQSKVKKIETSFVDLKWSHDRHTFQDEADDKLEAEGRLIVDRVAQKKVPYKEKKKTVKKGRVSSVVPSVPLTIVRTPKLLDTLALKDEGNTIKVRDELLSDGKSGFIKNEKVKGKVEPFEPSTKPLLNTQATNSNMNSSKVTTSIPETIPMKESSSLKIVKKPLIIERTSKTVYLKDELKASHTIAPDQEFKAKNVTKKPAKSNVDKKDRVKSSVIRNQKEEEVEETKIETPLTQNPHYQTQHPYSDQTVYYNSNKSQSYPHPILFDGGYPQHTQATGYYPQPNSYTYTSGYPPQGMMMFVTPEGLMYQATPDIMRSHGYYSSSHSYQENFANHPPVEAVKMRQALSNSSISSGGAATKAVVMTDLKGVQIRVTKTAAKK